MQNVYALDGYSSDEISRLSEIEKNIYGRAYVNRDYETRLKKAEKRVFGAVQSGTFNSRINLLSNVIDSSKQINNYPFIQRGYKRNTPLTILRNTFINRGGVITGFTPPPYPFYSQNQAENNYYNPQIHKKFPPTFRNQRKIKK